MDKKRIIICIIFPILLSTVSYFFSIIYIFKIPNPNGVGLAPETYYFAFILSMLVLAISSIISFIIYITNKRK